MTNIKQQKAKNRQEEHEEERNMRTCLTNTKEYNVIEMRTVGYW